MGDEEIVRRRQETQLRRALEFIHKYGGSAQVMTRTPSAKESYATIKEAFARLHGEQSAPGQDIPLK